jgi:hypothetical protein
VSATRCLSVDRGVSEASRRGGLARAGHHGDTRSDVISTALVIRAKRGVVSGVGGVLWRWAASTGGRVRGWRLGCSRSGGRGRRRRCGVVGGDAARAPHACAALARTTCWSPSLPRILKRVSMVGVSPPGSGVQADGAGASESCGGIVWFGCASWEMTARRLPTQR